MEIKFYHLGADMKREYLHLFKLLLYCTADFTDSKDEAMRISHLY